MNAWKVCFDDVFESSQGMQKYSVPCLEQELLVITEGDSLADVRKALESLVGEQTRVTKLRWAYWLGECHVSSVKTV